MTSRMKGVRRALARLGLADEPLDPGETHEFENDMQMLFAPALPSIASVPNVLTPIKSEKCARAGCDRLRADPIHAVSEG
jgi:hypothetical protein